MQSGDKASIQTVRGSMRVVYFLVLAPTLAGLLPSPARAQARAARALRKIQVEKTDAGWDLELFFEFPVRYL
ncbi:MAG: hypothetical protein AB8G23_02980, partial [Myxococcota bacterium]